MMWCCFSHLYVLTISVFFDFRIFESENYFFCRCLCEHFVLLLMVGNTSSTVLCVAISFCCDFKILWESGTTDLSLVEVLHFSTHSENHFFFTNFENILFSRWREKKNPSFCVEQSLDRNASWEKFISVFISNDFFHH